MDLQNLKYFAAVAEHKHFGRAAAACHVSQPTLSGQLRKLEEELGVVLFERTNKKVALTRVGERLLPSARRALEEAAQVESLARASCDPLQGPLKLGIIPTLAPSLIPLILDPLRRAYPGLTLEIWEDLTASLVDLLDRQRLDAVLLASELPPAAGLTALTLFAEPFVAALPRGHRLARQKRVSVNDLAPDLLVLADGHCLADQTLSFCHRHRSQLGPFQASSLDTLVNLVAAGYGTTLIPKLSSKLFVGRQIVLRPLQEPAARVIRLASRATFPRPQALRALEKVIRGAVPMRTCATAVE